MFILEQKTMHFYYSLIRKGYRREGARMPARLPVLAAGRAGANAVQISDAYTRRADPWLATLDLSLGGGDSRGPDLRGVSAKPIKAGRVRLG
jgi:hypothetical protein